MLSVMHSLAEPSPLPSARQAASTAVAGQAAWRAEALLAIPREHAALLACMQKMA